MPGEPSEGTERASLGAPGARRPRPVRAASMMAPSPWRSIRVSTLGIRELVATRRSRLCDCTDTDFEWAYFRLRYVHWRSTCRAVVRRVRHAPRESPAIGNGWHKSATTRRAAFALAPPVLCTRVLERVSTECLDRAYTVTCRVGARGLQ
jgi:hypothetical protein